MKMLLRCCGVLRVHATVRDETAKGEVFCFCSDLSGDVLLNVDNFGAFAL